MSGEAIIAVSAAVVALVQLIKWSSIIPDRWGPVAVLVLAAVGVGVWGYSVGDFMRASTFTYFAGWIAVATSAAGVFGFVRATNPGSVTTVHQPPPGAAQNPTEKL
jgi:hypothetical protein